MQCVGGALYPNAALVLWLRNAPVDIGQRSILLQKTNRACQVIDEFWCLFKANHDEIRTLSLVIVGIFGLCFAFWRCVIADRILKQERDRIRDRGKPARYKNHDYPSRVAGSAILTEIAKDDPKNYKKWVMKAFEAFLTYPRSLVLTKWDMGNVRSTTEARTLNCRTLLRNEDSANNRGDHASRTGHKLQNTKTMRGELSFSTPSSTFPRYWRQGGG